MFAAPRRLRACLVIAAAASTALLSIGRLDAQQQDAGVFPRITEDLSKLVKFAVVDHALKLDRDHWSKASAGQTEAERKQAIRQRLIERGLPPEIAEQQADRSLQTPDSFMMFEELARKVPHNRSGSSFSSNGRRERTFSGDAFSARMATTGESFELMLREETASRRWVELRDVGGELHVTLRGDGDQILILNQTPTWVRMTFSREQDPEPFSVGDKSFAALYRTHRQRFEEDVFPLMRSLGVVPPLAPLSPPVVESVLSRVRPIDPDLRAQVQAVVGQLSDSEFSVREEATNRLLEETQRFEPVVRELLAGDLPAETRARLERVLARHKEQYGEVEHLVESLGLLDDPAYLVELLEETSGADRRAVADSLGRLTGQSFGEDAAAWQAWLEAQKQSASR
jgi:hypothetical protein